MTSLSLANLIEMQKSERLVIKVLAYKRGKGNTFQDCTKVSYCSRSTPQKHTKKQTNKQTKQNKTKQKQVLTLWLPNLRVAFFFFFFFMMCAFKNQSGKGKQK